MTVAATTTEAGARPMQGRAPAFALRPGWAPCRSSATSGVFLLSRPASWWSTPSRTPAAAWNFGSVSTLWQPGRAQLLPRLVQAVPALGRGRGGVRGAAGVRGGVRQPGRRGAPLRAGRLGRARPVRRGHPGLRLPGAHRPDRAAVPRQLVLQLPLGHHPDLHLLPDPAHGAGLPARHRRAEAAVAGGLGEPGRLDLAVLAARGRPAARPGVLRRAAAAVRQRSVRLRDHPGLGEPDRVHRAAGRSAPPCPARSGWPT